MFAHEQAFLQALAGEPAALEALCASLHCREGLAIYKTSILSTLQQALYKTFKPLQALIGQELFQELCYRYATTHFSTTLHLGHYGAHLHEFVKTAPVAQDFPYLSDFVEFCFMWRQTYLHAGPEVTLIESDYPLYAIWQRCQPEFKAEVSIENWEGPFCYALYFENGCVNVDLLLVE